MNQETGERKPSRALCRLSLAQAYSQDALVTTDCRHLRAQLRSRCEAAVVWRPAHRADKSILHRQALHQSTATSHRNHGCPGLSMAPIPA